MYLHWMAFLLVADPWHWRQADCLAQEVKDLYHRLQQENLPRRFMYLTSADRWTRFKLNYMYMNLKCFRHDAAVKRQDTAACERLSAGAPTRQSIITGG